MQDIQDSMNSNQSEDPLLDQAMQKTEDQISTFIELFRSRHEFTRWVAITAMGESQDPVIVPYLIQALDDTSLSVRLNAAQALIPMGNFQGVPTLIKILTEEEMILGYPPLRANRVARKVLESFSGKNFGSLEHTDYLGKRRLHDLWADWWAKNHILFELESIG